MKTKGVFILLLACMGWISCKNGAPVMNQCGPCPEIAELIPVIEVKIVDKSTGNDLFLSPGSPYKFSDLKVTSSITGTNVNVQADTSQANNRFIRILSSGSQSFILQLASLKPDTIDLIAKRDSPKCCPRFAIKQITLNNGLVCSPCTISQLVTIKK